ISRQPPFYSLTFFDRSPAEISAAMGLHANSHVSSRARSRGRAMKAFVTSLIAASMLGLVAPPASALDFYGVGELRDRSRDRAFRACIEERPKGTRPNDP